MFSAEVGAVAETIRATLPLDPEWHMMNSVPAPLGGGPSPPDAPAPYTDFLRVANGFTPDTGVLWWQSDRFEQAAPSLDRFFLEVVCGPGYLRLSATGEDDQWWRLLTQIGRV